MESGLILRLTSFDSLGLCPGRVVGLTGELAVGAELYVVLLLALQAGNLELGCLGALSLGLLH